MSRKIIHHREDLFELFRQKMTEEEKIGIEIEIGCLDPATGRSIPYRGPVSVHGLLTAFERQEIGAPIFQEENLVGLDLGAKGEIALEHGGALEYCSPPAADLVQLVTEMRELLRRLAAIARTVGVALVPGGTMPFDPLDDPQWVPKPYGEFMREYFTARGDAGFGGIVVMVYTLSTQATLDFASDDDLIRKLRAAVTVAPVVTALFANTPIEEGRVVGALSRRTQHWFNCDPSRCGFLEPALRKDMTLDDFVDWALGLRMIYRSHQGRYIRAGDRPFGAIVRDGFEDGTRPTLVDWRMHLSQIWTDVRLRDKLELRAADGTPWEAVPTIPAFWSGLLYHPPSCEAVWQLFENRSLDELQAGQEDAARRGLAARLGPDRISDLAREVLRLAKAGLAARVEAGRERPEAMAYLEPLEEIVESGKTWAERLVERWRGELRRSPARYVESYRI